MCMNSSLYLSVSAADPKSYVAQLELRLERLEQEKLELIKVQ